MLQSTAESLSLAGGEAEGRSEPPGLQGRRQRRQWRAMPPAFNMSICESRRFHTVNGWGYLITYDQLSLVALQS